MNNERTAEVDVIRLAALIGIGIVNVPFMAMPMAEVLLPAPDSQGRWAVFLVETLFQMKFFLLFSFIFGWGMAVQVRSAQRVGASFRRRYFARLTVLAAIGIAHALLVFRGDIMLLYACLGLLLWPLRNLEAWALATLALKLLSVAVGTLCLAAILLDELGSIVQSNVGPGLAGSYWEAVVFRAGQWPLVFPMLVLVQGPLAYAAFVAGLAAAKSGLFEPGADSFIWLKRRQPVLLAIALPINAFYGLTNSGLVPVVNDWLSLAGFVGMALGAPALAAVYLYWLVLLARRLKLPEVLLLAGQNSLSAYVLQGILGGLFFGGFGLGQFGLLGHEELLVLSLAIALGSICLVGLWARRFSRGPLEPLLRLAVRQADRSAPSSPTR